MHKSQNLFYLIITLHVSGVTITHLQEHKTTVTTASANHYTVIDRVKFTDEFHQTRDKDKNKKRATFTYYSPKIRKFTNLFKYTNINTTFKNTNTIQQYTKPKTID
jgi:hypothetical protein